MFFGRALEETCHELEIDVRGLRLGLSDARRIVACMHRSMPFHALSAMLARFVVIRLVLFSWTSERGRLPSRLLQQTGSLDLLHQLETILHLPVTA